MPLKKQVRAFSPKRWPAWLKAGTSFFVIFEFAVSKNRKISSAINAFLGEQVPVYEYETPDGEFRYHVWYSQQPQGWVVDSAQVLRFNEPLLPRRPLKGEYSEAAQAIARGVQWCEIIVSHLKTVDFRET